MCPVFAEAGRQVGKATSHGWSPILKQAIALASRRPALRAGRHPRAGRVDGRGPPRPGQRHGGRAAVPRPGAQARVTADDGRIGRLRRLRPPGRGAPRALDRGARRVPRDRVRGRRRRRAPRRRRLDRRAAPAPRRDGRGARGRRRAAARRRRDRRRAAHRDRRPALRRAARLARSSCGRRRRTSPTIRDGRVWARGATDNKGEFLPRVWAVEAWLEADRSAALPRPLPRRGPGGDRERRPGRHARSPTPAARGRRGAHRGRQPRHARQALGRGRRQGDRRPRPQPADDGGRLALERVVAAAERGAAHDRRARDAVGRRGPAGRRGPGRRRRPPDRRPASGRRVGRPPGPRRHARAPGHRPVHRRPRRDRRRRGADVRADPQPAGPVVRPHRVRRRRP